jgi:hypothetical protein
MARPGQLANAIAEVFDHDVATVRQQARMLRDAGQMGMEKGGRGVGSMTPRDATNLLIAVAGSSRVKYSTRPVEQHGACISKEGAWRFPFEGLPELLALGPDHTFADAAEALLCAAINGSVDPETAIINTPDSRHEEMLRVEVSMHDPLPISEIRIGLRGFDQDGTPQMVRDVSRRYEIRVSGAPDANGAAFVPPFQTFESSDLTHRHSFTEKAIFRLAREFR